MSALRNNDRQFRFIIRARRDILDLPHHQQSVEDAAEDDVFVVQKVAFGARDEELAAVGVFAAVGHREEARSVVFQNEILVSEGAGAENGANTGAVSLKKQNKVEQMLS